MTDEEVKCPYEGCVRIFAAVRADAYHAHLDMHMLCAAIMDAGIGIVEALEGEEVETEEAKEDEGEEEKPDETSSFFKKAKK